MKKLFALTIALSSLMPTQAFEADLDGVKFTIDTIYSHIVGPGVTQTKYLLSNGSGRSFNVYTSTLSRSKGATAGLVEPRVVIGNDKCQTGERVSSMAARHTGGEYQLLTGINGDFFITSSFAAQHEFGNAILGYPNMSCVIDRKVAAPDMIDVISRENALIVTADNWYIDATDFVYEISPVNGEAIRATAINYPRRDGEMMLYNSYMGASTATSSGRELVLLKADDAQWSVNSKIRFIVDGEWIEGGNTSIPTDGLVISCGSNYSNDWLNSLKKGDEVDLYLGISLPAHDGITPDIVQVIGGDVRILNQGEITREAIRWINTPGSPYQRSLVGFSKDRDMMMFAAVDGSGLSYFESAALMRELGCYDALGMDGGGSTAIWSDAFGIYNKPRDGSERAIGNALFFALKAPVDKTVASIGFADHAVRLPKYGTYNPVIYGYNQYGQLVDTNISGFELSAPAELGTINGTSMTASGSGTHALTAKLGEMTATIAITVDNSSPIELVNTSLLIDNFHPVKIKLFSVVNGENMSVDPAAFSWTSGNPAIADVSAEGVITGISDGITKITGNLGEHTLSIDVVVECPTANTFDIIGSDASVWESGGSGTSTTSIIINENNSLSVDFTIKNARAPKLSLRRDVTLWSCPDAIQVVMNPGDISVSSASVAIIPNGGRQISAEIENIVANTDNTLRFNVSDFFEDFDNGIYPIQFRNLTLSLSIPKGDYNINIKSIEAIYDSWTDGIENIVVDPTETINPIVIGDYISLNKQFESISIYDLSGRKLDTIDNSASITKPGPGLYVIVATSGNTTLSTKLIIN